MPFTPLPRLDNHLTNLCVDVGNIDWIPTLVNCFPDGTLKSLSVPGCSRDGDPPTTGDHTYIDHSITRHMGALDKVRLLRAWRTDQRWIDELSDRWQGTYAIQELILGTRNPEWYKGPKSTWKKKSPAPTLTQYLCGFHRKPTDTRCGRWGSELRRIRIDDIHCPYLNVSVLSEPFYSHLKILMLRPAPRGAYKPNENNPNRPSSCEPVGETIRDKLTKPIIARGAPSLRVIVIRANWYWVSRDTAAASGSSHEHEHEHEHDAAANNGKIWTWGDARCDPTQNEIMSSTLDEADLDFLERSSEAVPFWDERDTMELNRNLVPLTQPPQPRQPSVEMFDRWNYLTMLPVA